MSINGSDMQGDFLDALTREKKVVWVRQICATLEYSPDINPLVEVRDVPVKRRYVSTGLKTDLIDSDGVVQGASVIRTSEEKDDAEFVKVFAAGIAASYDLTKTGQKVFQAVLSVYQDARMSGGFADQVYLKWFDEGLSGHAIDMSEKTFRRGLKELLALGFLSPKTPSVYWINPALFFKGNRVLFVREYRRKSSALEAQGSSGLIWRRPNDKPSIHYPSHLPRAIGQWAGRLMIGDEETCRVGGGDSPDAVEQFARETGVTFKGSDLTTSFTNLS